MKVCVRKLALLPIVGLTALAACSSSKIDVGDDCMINSDCESPLVCSMSRCHQACKETRDCPVGQSCIVIEGAGVCQLPAEADCTATACRIGLLCAADMRCHTQCLSDTNCSKGQLCVDNLCADPTQLSDGGWFKSVGLDAGTDLGAPDATSDVAPPDASADLARPDASADLARPDASADLARPDASADLATPDASADLAASDVTDAGIEAKGDTGAGDAENPVDVAMDAVPDQLDARPADVDAIVDPTRLPSIVSFIAGANPVNAGHATTLTATFNNGTGAISPDIGLVLSGTAVATGILNQSTTFTLTVTGSEGQTATARVTVTVLIPPQPIASVGGFVAAFATDGSNLYFGLGTDILKLSTAGGTPVPLATVSPAGANAIATDGANVYWTEQTAGVVGKVAVTGGGQGTLATGQYYANAITVAGDSVYWTTLGTLASVPDAGPGGTVNLPTPPDNTGTVMKAAIAGGAPPVVLASQQSNPTTVAVHGNNVYWAGTSTDLGGTLSTVAIAGGESPRNLGVGLQVGSTIATDDRGIYWLSLAMPSGIVRMPFSGGATSPVAASSLPPFRATLVLDADSVYWTGFQGAPGVLKAPLDGSGAALTLASLPSTSTPTLGIALDATNVYYVTTTTNGGDPTPTSTFYKVAK